MSYISDDSSSSFRVPSSPPSELGYADLAAPRTPEREAPPNMICIGKDPVTGEDVHLSPPKPNPYRYINDNGTMKVVPYWQPYDKVIEVYHFAIDQLDFCDLKNQITRHELGHQISLTGPVPAQLSGGPALAGKMTVVILPKVLRGSGTAIGFHDTTAQHIEWLCFREVPDLDFVTDLTSQPDADGNNLFSKVMDLEYEKGMRETEHRMWHMALNRATPKRIKLKLNIDKMVRRQLGLGQEDEMHQGNGIIQPLQDPDADAPPSVMVNGGGSKKRAAAAVTGPSERKRSKRARLGSSPRF
ncbi:hypothetical protein P154DRAFT_530334 [Amniculicola lignicola CBS 123094]|uniref:Uncharacterized protein n=1 Tax=Amniculicola lignicola CBS 123094 TaxID=1392246 RepID=A0A6A5WWR8_9PLEO|nr:hypothetical protein P154DRAFT_530334 [Amniculicola lignicola CBS 123094]